HHQMIAIGAVIGVGLLIRSGNILRLGRPLPLVMSFPLLGVLAACVTMSIAEMISIRPLSGVLIRSTTRDLSVFVTEYIDPDLGSTVAVAYWFTYAWSFAAFLAVMSALMQYWELPSGIYEGTLYLLVPAILVVYNRSDIRLYGMIEVIGGTMKLCLLVLLMIAMIQGAGADLKTKTLHCPEKITGSDLDAANGWTQAFLMSLSIAAFAYIGVETIAMSTEETCAKAKRRYPPSSTVKFLKSFPACISILPGIMYFLAGVLVSLNGSWDDPRLPRMSWVTDSDGDMKSTASAFVLAVEESKIPGLASTLNLFLIFIVLDYANTSLYVASRSLFNLAVSLNGRPGQPWYVRLLSYFGRTNKSQVPSRALVASCIFVCVPILLSANGRGRDINAGIILDVFSTLGSTGIIIIWASQCWAYIRLSSCIENNREELHDMPFIQHWNGGKTSNFPHRIQRRPITAYVSLGACLFILVVANSASQWQDFNLQPLLSAYLPLICFTSLYVFIKVMRKSRWQLVDISSGGDLASKLFWLHEEE
ncbi:putative amino acid transporter, partial [Ophiobolus disseminans]